MVNEIPEIPLPPDDLMIAVANHTNHADFARSRLNGPQQMVADLEQAGAKVDSMADLLDFGCGCGRFLAGWLMRGTPMQLHGCDFNPALVKWCQDNLPGADVKQNRLGEILPFADGTFDLVYLVSVFTHLTLDEQRRLAREFRRITRPGGYVYITFHGRHYYEEMFARIPGGAAEFERNGFLIEHATQEGGNYCFTIHSPDRLAEIMEGFQPILHLESSTRGPTDVGAWQDSLILKRL